MSRRDKGKRPAPSSSSSDSNNKSFQALAPSPKTQKITEDLFSNHLTIWREEFDLSQLPQTITLDLMKRAPFLLGADRAKYSVEFFQSMGGLCGGGIPFESLLKDDHGVPVDDLLATYPYNKAGNRHSMKLMTNRDAARDALHMYQRVYGSTQPDNAEFGTAFIRGLVLFYQHRTEVNWAQHAAELAKQRLRNPGQNPQKLIPLCLREQIQEMINLFEHYLRQAYAAHDTAVRQLKQAKIPLKPASTIPRKGPPPEAPPLPLCTKREPRTVAPPAEAIVSSPNHGSVRQQRSGRPIPPPAS